jgi:hypothetical protein
MKGNELDISTRYVNSISAKLPKAWISDVFKSFPFPASGWLLRVFLINPPYSLPTDLVAYTAPLFRNAIMAHFAGDEKFHPRNRQRTMGSATIP